MFLLWKWWPQNDEAACKDSYVLAAKLVSDSYVERRVVESLACNRRFADKRRLKLDKIIDKILCRAKPAKDFAFDIKTSDVEEWVNIVLVMSGRFYKN